MGEKNIDRLRNKNDDVLIKNMVELFSSLGVPMPYTLCKGCEGRSSHCDRGCDFTDEEFMAEWLYSEKKRIY